MKNIKICGLYKIVSPARKIYIGQSRDINHRFYRSLSNGIIRQRRLYASLKKYGAGNHIFEIIHQLPIDISNTILDNYEELYIGQYKNCAFELMNLTGGGKSNRDLSKETREKLKKAATGKKYWLSKKHTEETKQKIREANTGTIFSKLRLSRMSQSQIGKPGANLGKPMSIAAKEKLSKFRIGKKHSQETKIRIAQALKNRVFTDAHRLKISIALKGKPKRKV